MNLDKIEKLVKIIEESSLQEFSIQEGDIKIKMSKRAGESVAVPFAPGMGMPVAGTAAPEAATADETSGEVEEETYITSPIVGTFYSAPSPEAKAFVKVGDRVKAGETVWLPSRGESLPNAVSPASPMAETAAAAAVSMSL